MSYWHSTKIFLSRNVLHYGVSTDNNHNRRHMTKTVIIYSVVQKVSQQIIHKC